MGKEIAKSIVNLLTKVIINDVKRQGFTVVNFNRHIAAFQVKIRFVDLGLVEDIQPSCLCQLPKEFVDIPFQVGFEFKAWFSYAEKIPDNQVSLPFHSFLICWENC